MDKDKKALAVTTDNGSAKGNVYRGKTINLDLVKRRLETAMMRDSKAILAETDKGKLGKASVDSLAQYLRLIKVLKQMEREDLAQYTQEELQKIADQDESDGSSDD